MHAISVLYVSRAETWLLITTLIYFLMNGAQVYETAVIIPKWTKSAPASLKLLQGTYALDLKTFWVVIHSFHEITFVAAIAFCWGLPVRNSLLVLFFIHFAVRAWTIFYFAPNIMAFQKVPGDATADPELLWKVRLWRKLNYLRVGIFIGVSIGLAGIYFNIAHLSFRIF